MQSFDLSLSLSLSLTHTHTKNLSLYSILRNEKVLYWFIILILLADYLISSW